MSSYKTHLFSPSVFILITSHTKNLCAPAFFPHYVYNILRKAILKGMRISAFVCVSLGDKGKVAEQPETCGRVPFRSLIISCLGAYLQ